MALTKLEKISDNSLLAIWKIEEPLSEMVTLLSPSTTDLHLLDTTIHHPQKKLEWGASRLALKTVLLELGINEYLLYKDEYGKPYINIDQLHVSLANSYPYAVAMVRQRFPIGVDIEKPSVKLQRVAEKYLSHYELQSARENLIHLCKFWCAKETIYKVYGRKQLSLKNHIYVELDRQNEAVIHAVVDSPSVKAEHQLNTFLLDDFYFCYNL